MKSQALEHYNPARTENLVAARTGQGRRRRPGQLLKSVPLRRGAYDIRTIRVQPAGAGFQRCGDLERFHTGFCSNTQAPTRSTALPKCP